jgi:energy-coupling factor transport system ATP-binding protein
MPIIEIKDLTHVYLAGTPYEKKALEKISFSINQGEFVGIIGANGSGKSTLIQHFNGLLVPTGGTVRVCGEDTLVKRHRRNLWKKVGIVFQFPEQQIFKSTVFEEVAYGLKNMGMNLPEIKNRVEETLAQVGLNPGEVAHLSPLSLSGGTRCQVAIASIMAMRPDILVLDEPTAGLDSSGCNHIIKAIEEMQQEYHTTVVMISHYVSQLMLLADKLVILEQGRLLACGTQEEVFQYMIAHNLGDFILPDYLRLMHHLADYGYQVNTRVFSVEQAAREIGRILKGSFL